MWRPVIDVSSPKRTRKKGGRVKKKRNRQKLRETGVCIRDLNDEAMAVNQLGKRRDLQGVKKESFKRV